MMKFHFWSYVLLSILVLGCGRGHVPMGGRVTFIGSDEPLTTGAVVFLAQNFQARGALDKNGRYTIGSFTDTDGLPPGEYSVYIHGAVSYGSDEKGRIKTIVLIDPKFTDATTSGLKVNVDGSTKIFDFQVEKPAVKTAWK